MIRAGDEWLKPDDQARAGDHRRDGSVTLLVSNFGPFIGRIEVLSQNFTLFEVGIVLDAFTRDWAAHGWI